MEKVRDEGVYLLENGIHVLLFVGLAVDPQWIQVPSRFCLTPIYDLQMFILIGQVETLLYLSKSQWNLSGKSQDVFGVATAAQIDIDKTKLVERDNQLSRRVSQLTNYVNKILPCLSS